MSASLQAWLRRAGSQPGADILIVQTLRNAIMAASVLASAAMVALMGILATAHLHPRIFSMIAAALLALSAAAAVSAIVRLSNLGIDMQQDEKNLVVLASKLIASQRASMLSASALALALSTAAAAVFA